LQGYPHKVSLEILLDSRKGPRSYNQNHIHLHPSLIGRKVPAIYNTSFYSARTHQGLEGTEELLLIKYKLRLRPSSSTPFRFLDRVEFARGQINTTSTSFPHTTPDSIAEPPTSTAKYPADRSTIKQQQHKTLGSSTFLCFISRHLFIQHTSIAKIRMDTMLSNGAQQPPQPPHMRNGSSSNNQFPRHMSTGSLSIGNGQSGPMVGGAARIDGLARSPPNRQSEQPTI
jgi:hypothetical protein